MSTGDNSVKWWPWLMLSYDDRIIGTNRQPFRSKRFNVCCILKILTYSKSKSLSDLNPSRRDHPDLLEFRLLHDTPTTELPRIRCINHEQISLHHNSVHVLMRVSCQGCNEPPASTVDLSQSGYFNSTSRNRVFYLCVICACCFPISSWALCTNVCLHFTVLRKVPVKLVF